LSSEVGCTIRCHSCDFPIHRMRIASGLAKSHVKRLSESTALHCPPSNPLFLHASQADQYCCFSFLGSVAQSVRRGASSRRSQVRFMLLVLLKPMNLFSRAAREFESQLIGRNRQIFFTRRGEGVNHPNMRAGGSGGQPSPGVTKF
jgi:hypothetical protein